MRGIALHDWWRQGVFVEHLENEYSQILNQMALLVSQACKRTVGFKAMNNDPRVVAAWLGHRLEGHLRAFAVLLNAHLLRDAEGAERAAVEAAICLEGLRAAPEDFMDALRKDASSTLQGQIPIWRALDDGLAVAAEKHRAAVFGLGKQPRLNLSTLADGAANPMLYRRYKHLSANSVHITGLSLTSDGAELFGLGKINATRRRDTIAWMTYAAYAGGSSFAGLMGYSDLKNAMAQIMLRLEDHLADLEEMPST